LIEIQNPFSAGGTATFPGHSFFYTPEDDVNNILIRFAVQTYPDNIYTYDPYTVEGDEEQTKKNLSLLNEEDLQQYLKMRKSFLFSQEYKKFTGRSYLAHYPRERPPHFMWRADYFNQTHWITSLETKFRQKPTPEQLAPINQYGKIRSIPNSDPRPLAEFRDTGVLNMTLKVLSCAPRVFEIADFLSDVEVQHILDLAAAEELGLSLTGSGETNEDAADVRQTRTSYNSWLERERSPIIDVIYRRASDLLRIDEALLRYRGDGEYPQMASNNTIAESLQLVHYDPGQEYTAHHDFGFSDFDDEFQAQRFATLLLYLNEGMTGGATSFPRWVNAETFDELKVLPEVGKAVLFYSQLPDGNMDDFSHHEAKKVIDGEKWLINLWVWGPLYP
jgi:prolyl 4-hydroxylase